MTSWIILPALGLWLLWRYRTLQIFLSPGFMWQAEMQDGWATIYMSSKPSVALKNIPQRLLNNFSLRWRLHSWEDVSAILLTLSCVILLGCEEYCLALSAKTQRASSGVCTLWEHMRFPVVIRESCTVQYIRELKSLNLCVSATEQKLSLGQRLI